MGLNKPFNDYTVKELFQEASSAAWLYANDPQIEEIAVKPAALRYRVRAVQQFLDRLKVIANDVEFGEDDE